MLEVLAPHYTAMLITFLPMRSKEMLAHVTYASAAHADLVHDVTDSNCKRQNGHKTMF